MKNRFPFLFLAVWGLAVSQVLAAASPSLIVVPARLRTVKLAFDVARLRSPALISYATTTNSPEPKMFLWSAGEWKPISVEDFSRGGFLPQKPKVVFLVGSDRDMPAAVVDGASSWGTDVRRVSTLDIGEMAVAFDSVYHFSGYEWRALADNNGLTIVDTNADRRRYGRYGKPGAGKPDATSVAPTSQMQIQPVKDTSAELAPPAVKLPEAPAKAAVQPPKVNPADK